LALGVAIWQAHLAANQFKDAQGIQAETDKRRIIDDQKAEQREKQQAQLADQQLNLGQHQILALQKQAEQVGKSAELARQSAIDTLKIQQSGERAYLVLDSITYDPNGMVVRSIPPGIPDKYRGEWTATFRNIGHTPALAVRTTGRAFWASGGSKIEMPEIPEGWSQGDDAVPSGETTLLSIMKELSPPPTNVHFVNLVVLVVAEYRDVFGNRERIEACRLNIMPREIEGAYYPCYKSFKIEHSRISKAGRH
jgi:hypothetical protein